MAEQAANPLISVEVVCALPTHQELVELQLPLGATARDAVTRSGIAHLFPAIDVAESALAIFGVAVADDYQLSAGDRVAVLRELHQDPREARRELAALGKTMGGRPDLADD